MPTEAIIAITNVVSAAIGAIITLALKWREQRANERAEEHNDDRANSNTTLDAMKALNNALASRLACVENNLAQTTARVAELERENARLKAQLTIAQAKIEDLRQKTISQQPPAEN